MNFVTKVKLFWKNQDLRKKFLVTLLFISVFRIGSCIPVPFVNPELISSSFLLSDNTMSLFDMFSGGSFSSFTLFALGVSPYISTTIIIQILASAVPSLGDLYKEGVAGKKTLKKITAIVTIALSLVQGFGYAFALFDGMLINNNFSTKFWSAIIIICCSLILTYVASRIENIGIGSGVSLVICASIICRMPAQIKTLFKNTWLGIIDYKVTILYVVLAIISILIVILINDGVRRIPVTYSTKTIGYNPGSTLSDNTNIPIKVNQSSVMPVIFASAMLQAPQIFVMFFPNSKFAEKVTEMYSFSSAGSFIVYVILFALLILFFTYFYNTMFFKSDEIAENIKNNGGFIPGFRPGKPTAEYLDHVSKRLCLISAVFLSIIAVMPVILYRITGVQFSFGGTALIIVVGVAIDTLKCLEVNLEENTYLGFIG